MTHPLDTLLEKFKASMDELGDEAKKALPAYLEVEDIERKYPRSDNYELYTSKFRLVNVDIEDKDFAFESADEYVYVPFDFAKDPKTHLEAAKKEAAEREAERNDRKLRLRNERIREAKETLRLEGYDISKLGD